MSPYDRDADRARQDRLASTGGLVSIAYWIVQAFALGCGFVVRKLRSRSG